MAKRKNNIEFKCESCEKPQPINKEQSNANWNYYDCNVKCKCGGKFVMFLNGEKVGK